MTNIKKPRGTLDILPAETRAWRYAEDIIRREAAASGFEEIRFPTFESTELFDRGVGGTTDIVQKEMYTFTDRDGRSLSLRPEGTAGVARSVIENGLYAGAMPLKLYYLTNFFRYEKPQAGRSREFFQFGTELYGADGPEGDAEVIALADRVLRRLGLQSCALNLNSIGCADCPSRLPCSACGLFPRARVRALPHLPRAAGDQPAAHPRLQKPDLRGYCRRCAENGRLSLRTLPRPFHTIAGAAFRLRHRVHGQSPHRARAGLLYGHGV